MQYHLLSLARDGLDAAVERMDVSPQLSGLKRVLKRGVHIVNCDGSIDDECAPMTMTIKSRLYALGAPRSVEVHYVHKSCAR
jgi:hypothetical protein